MGSVSSKMSDKPAIYICEDNSKFFLNSIIITDIDDKAPIYINADAYPSALVNTSCGNKRLIEFVFDPEASNHESSPFLLKLTLNHEINIKFNITFKLHTFQDKSSFLGLIFIYGINTFELDNILALESEKPTNARDILPDNLLEKEFEWLWKWKPHSAKDENFNGWRNTCYFVQCEKDNKFSVLSKFSFWVQDNEKCFQKNTDFFSDKKILSSPHIDISSQSISNDKNEPSSPEKANISFNSLLDNMNSVVNFNNFDDVFKNEPNDGPLFRATITALEKKASVFGYRIKKVIKRAVELYDCQVAKNEANRRFMNALRKASESNPIALKPVLALYMEVSNQQLQSFEYNNALQLQSLIIRPLRRIYEVDIKAAEGKKKDFDEYSRNYYHFVSRYILKFHIIYKNVKI
ncbi:hypothetical protein PORY_001225 [Pneumocystis oryctolagi]|uniref:Uncharacterized protein n=1 Tax=Pneumocystis oryctolagi TaxID=42067 RepID=A0ACB7CFK5_9ASCO|nr:hypothetical protein PORY_001225 [Pneumocystis oryctolagi]